MLQNSLYDAMAINDVKQLSQSYTTIVIIRYM